jgi:hypothetical protein
MTTTNAAGPSPREIIAEAVGLLNDDRTDVPPSSGYADTIIAALESAGYAIVRESESYNSNQINAMYAVVAEVAIARGLDHKQFWNEMDRAIIGNVDATLPAPRQRAGVVERATIERGVMDGYDAAGFRWDEKLREYDGQLDGHDAYAVIVTSITDAVLAEIDKSRATGDGET